MKFAPPVRVGGDISSNSEHFNSKTIYVSLTLEKKLFFFEQFNSKTIYLGPGNGVKVGREAPTQGPVATQHGEGDSGTHVRF